MNPANRVRDIYEFAPKRPETGWMVWRDALADVWVINLYVEGKHIYRIYAGTNFEARKRIQDITMTMDEKTKRAVRIAEIFNEASYYEEEADAEVP